MKNRTIGAFAAALTLVLLAGCSGDLRFQRGTRPSIEREAYQALSQMVRAYEDKRLGDFMDLVHEDFAGDDMILESAVQQDFSRLARIQLNISPAGAARSFRGERVLVTVHFSRQLTPVATGVPMKDMGLTQVVLKKTDGGWRLLSMKQPKLFGMSGAVATGSVSSAGNPDTLKLKDDGTLTR